MSGLLHRCTFDGELIFPDVKDGLARHLGHRVVLATDGSLGELVRWKAYQHKGSLPKWIARLLNI